MTSGLRVLSVLLIMTLFALPSLAAETASASSASTSPAVGQGDAALVWQLRQQLDLQQQKIDRLEAKVGLPTTPVGWTWFLVGMIGEGVFFLRFVVQWWASERKKRTVVPMAFWHLSLIGTALVLTFAVFVEQPVFILAYSLNIFLYVRNLYIARRTPALAELAEKESE